MVYYKNMLKKFDILVVGGGVVGCAILEKLSKYNLSVALIEAENDVACGASRANSGLVHAGFDCVPGSLKAELNAKGNFVFEDLCRNLSIDVRRNGAMVAAEKDGLGKLEELLKNGKKNKIPEIEIIEFDKIHSLEKNLNKKIEYALRAKTAKIVSPYLLTVALAESAAINNAKIFLNTRAVKAEIVDGCYVVETSNSSIGKICADYVINASGAFAGPTNDIFGAEPVKITFRKGEYYILDTTEKDLVSHTIFPLPNEFGKGVLVTPTIDNNILVGPTATDEKFPFTDVTYSGLNFIKASASKIVSNINYSKNIRVYAGVRAYCGDDFIIQKSKKIENYIYLAGINSPGLTAAPAIADYVFNLLNLGCKEKHDIKFRKRYTETRKMDTVNLNKLIKKNPDYGEIVCRCESITKGEVIEALNTPLDICSVDSIKRRVRAGGGRCQGGFCTAKIMKIISEVKNVPVTKINKDCNDSVIAPYKI